jgi:hypothetical protein
MGVGPNYVLSKGFLGEGSAAYSKGEIVVQGTAEQAVARATASAATNDFVGIVVDTIDVAKVLTGKAQVTIAIMGIARVKAGAAVTKGAKLTNDTSARAVTVTRAAAGAQPQNIIGIALTSCSNANEHVDVLLTPGGSY